MMTYDKLSFCVHEVKHKNTTLSPETAPLESRKQNPNCFNSSDKGCCLKPKMRKKMSNLIPGLYLSNFWERTLQFKA